MQITFPTFYQLVTARLRLNAEKFPKGSCTSEAYRYRGTFAPGRAFPGSHRGASSLLMPTGASERGFNRLRPCLRPPSLSPKCSSGEPRVRLSKGRRRLVASPAAPDSNPESATDTHARAFTNTFRSDLQADWNPPQPRNLRLPVQRKYSLEISNWGPEPPPQLKKYPGPRALSFPPNGSVPRQGFGERCPRGFLAADSASYPFPRSGSPPLSPLHPAIQATFYSLGPSVEQVLRPTKVE